jgi:hypothetical protein
MPHVQSRASTGSGTSFSLAFAANNTAGNLLVAAVSGFGVAITSLSDTRGNAWQSGPSVTGSDPGTALRYAANCAAGSNTVSVTLASNSSWSLSIAEYSGVAPSNPLDKSATGTGFGTSASTPPVTTTQADELLVCVTSRNNINTPATFSPGANFTERTDTGGGRPQQLADRTVVAIGNYAGAAILDTSSGWSQVLATFLAPSSVPVSRTGTLVAEGLRSVTLTGSLPVAALGTPIAVRLLTAECLAARDRTGSVPIQSLAGLAPGQTLAAESLTPAALPGLMPVAWRGTLRSLAQLAVRWDGMALAGGVWIVDRRGDVWVVDRRTAVWRLAPRESVWILNER